jgi:hypothetical protein
MKKIALLCFILAAPLTIVFINCLNLFHVMGSYLRTKK